MSFNYSSIRWIVNGELLDASNINRPLSDAMELIASYLDSDVYTKAHIDDQFYTKDYIDEHFFTKTHITGTYYTRAESDARYMLSSDVGDGYYTKNYIDDHFFTKTYIENNYPSMTGIRQEFYDKTEVDMILEGFSPENRFKTVTLGSSHIYNVVSADVGTTIRFLPSPQNPPNIMTVVIPTADFGKIGDEIVLIAPVTNEFTDGDEAITFISNVSSQITTPMTAVGHLPSFRAGMSTVTMRKVTDTGAGMADWILSGDLALYTAADLWVDIVLRADLFVQQSGDFIDYVLFPYQVAGQWEWRPLAFAQQEVAGTTVTTVRDVTETFDTLNVRSMGTPEDFSSFVVVTKPIPRGKSVQMSVTTNSWSTPGTAVMEFAEQLPADPSEIGTKTTFTGNRTYTSEPSLESAPMYIAVKNTNDAVKPLNVNLSVQFVD